MREISVCILATQSARTPIPATPSAIWSSTARIDFSFSLFLASFSLTPAADARRASPFATSS